MKKLLFLLILGACVPDPEFSLDPDLAPYVESFFKEAELRGYQLRTSNLIVYKEDDLKKNYNAKAMYRKEKGQVSIAFDREYYSIIGKYHDRIESLMFHELGHAILKRGHSKCYSLMYEGACETCYENDPVRRKLLIDELFNPCTPP